MGLTARLYKAIFDLMGWRVVDAHHVALYRKGIFVVAPHTSWRDVPVGYITSKIIEKQTGFIAKKELFRFPMGIFLKAMGGIPVDRSRKSNLVDQVVRIFEEREEIFLAITPEATRERVDRFRSGFYYMAINAKVPLFLIQFNFERKEVVFSEAMYPGDDKEADFHRIYTYFHGVPGYHPEKSFYYNEADQR